ncbi:MAG: helix-turn-helix domain-containing protein [Bacteroidia bacterium]
METTDLKIICLNSEAFFKLIDVVVERIRDKENIKEDRWIGADEAKRLLNIKSRSTLAELRNKGKIRYSGSERNIVYDRTSIELYLEMNAKQTF